MSVSLYCKADGKRDDMDEITKMFSIRQIFPEELEKTSLKRAAS